MQKQVDYKQALGTRYPEQVVIVIARDENGKANPVTLGWTMLTSHKPPMMAFSVGLTRYSLNVIREAGEFVIAFPSESQAKETLFFGTRSGRDTDKLIESGIATVPAKKINCLLLDGAVANFECSVMGEFPTGDHVIFVGEVLLAHINPDAQGRLYTVAKGFKMSGISCKS